MPLEQILIEGREPLHQGPRGVSPETLFNLHRESSCGPQQVDPLGCWCHGCPGPLHGVTLHGCSSFCQGCLPHWLCAWALQDYMGGCLKHPWAVRTVNGCCTHRSCDPEWQLCELPYERRTDWFVMLHLHVATFHKSFQWVSKGATGPRPEIFPMRGEGKPCGTDDTGDGGSPPSPPSL